nr:hypothetical protein CFP56_03850 [Quercus suber]
MFCCRAPSRAVSMGLTWRDDDAALREFDGRLYNVSPASRSTEWWPRWPSDEYVQVTTRQRSFSRILGFVIDLSTIFLSSILRCSIHHEAQRSPTCGNGGSRPQ